MRCPACDVDMFVLEFEQVEIDWCPQCAGVWLDSGELELIGERTGALEAELKGALASDERARPRAGRRPCPICGKAMSEVQTDTEPPIVLDRCGREHGLWFDKGELEAVVKAAGASEGNVLAKFFAELSGTSQDPETE